MSKKEQQMIFICFFFAIYVRVEQHRNRVNVCKHDKKTARSSIKEVQCGLMGGERESCGKERKCGENSQSKGKNSQSKGKNSEAVDIDRSQTEKE
jgi:hypothetical protein